LEIANSVEPAQDGRIHIEKINWPFLSEFKGSPAEYAAGLKLAIERGWLWLHESGTYVKFTEAGQMRSPVAARPPRHVRPDWWQPALYCRAGPGSINA
jgi:hypothetical protein